MKNTEQTERELLEAHRRTRTCIGQRGPRSRYNPIPLLGNMVLGFRSFTTRFVSCTYLQTCRSNPWSLLRRVRHVQKPCMSRPTLRLYNIWKRTHMNRRMACRTRHHVRLRKGVPNFIGTHEHCRLKQSGSMLERGLSRGEHLGVVPHEHHHRTA